MGQILLGDLDDALIAAYRDAAVRNARTIEEEMRGVLSEMRPRTAPRSRRCATGLGKLGR